MSSLNITKLQNIKKEPNLINSLKTNNMGKVIFFVVLIIFVLIRLNIYLEEK